MTEEERAERVEWIRQQAEAAKLQNDRLLLEQSFLRTLLQSLLAQLASETKGAGLEAVRIRLVATLASPMPESAGENETNRAQLQLLAHKFFSEVREMAGLPNETAQWGN